MNTFDGPRRGRQSAQNLPRLLAKHSTALVMMLVGLAASAHGQGLLTVLYNNTMNANDTAYIDPIFNMPDISLRVAGDCISASYSLTVTYMPDNDPAISQTVADSLPCGEWTDVDWSQLFLFPFGGNVSLWVTVSTECEDNYASFPFVLAGQDPSPSTVDQYMAYWGAPWFFPSMVAEESKGRIIAPYQYHQFDPRYGDRPIYGFPHGYGIAQPDPPIRDDDYWDWGTNLLDGLGVLTGKKTGAYNHWNAQLNQSIADGGPNPPTIYYGNNCAFQYPQNVLDYFGDADWIHAYNGGYFTVWNRPDSSTGRAGYWSFDPNGSGYVATVCATNPF